MNLDIKDIITLEDDNKYLVVSKTTYNDKIYYSLSDMKNSNNIMICYENQGKLTEVDDNITIEALLPLFEEASQKALEELMQEEKN